MLQEEYLDLVLVNRARATFYKFFNKVYLELVDKEFLDMVESVLPDLKLLAMDSDNVYIKDGYAGLEKLFADRGKLSGEELEEFDLDAARRYTRLFCLNDSVPMVESVYTSKDKLVMQESRDKIFLLLKKYHLERSVSEFDDHISVELAFMGYLASSAADALEKDDNEAYATLIKEQMAFHENHLDVWLGMFCDAVFSFDVKGEVLFNSFTKMLKGFVAEDREVLQDLSV